MVVLPARHWYAPEYVQERIVKIGGVTRRLSTTLRPQNGGKGDAPGLNRSIDELES